MFYREIRLSRLCILSITRHMKATCSSLRKALVNFQLKIYSECRFAECFSGFCAVMEQFGIIRQMMGVGFSVTFSFFVWALLKEVKFREE